VVRIARSAAEEIAAVGRLFGRYDKVPASLADAGLIRIPTLCDPRSVLTLDSDFRINRRHARKGIARVLPDCELEPLPLARVRRGLHAHTRFQSNAALVPLP
jgi:hypothetical protein